MTKYRTLPLEDIARRYLAGETMPVLAAEFDANPPGLYRRLVRDGLIPTHPKSAAGGAAGARTSRDEFIEIWNSSASAKEAAARAHVGYNTAVIRAVKYRKRGIPMKKYPRGRRSKERLSLRTCRNSKCPNGFTFKTDNPRAEYCSSDCRKAAQNRRYYVAHREDVISRVLVARKKD